MAAATLSQPRATLRYVPRRGVFNACAALLLAALLPSAAVAGTDVRLLVLGDSLTAGYGLAAEEAFPRQLEAALRADGIEAVVVDGGVSGDTSAGGLARLGWSLAEAPDAAIVELGSNDGLRGLDPAQTRANLAAIIGRLQAEGVTVLLAGMYAPPNLGREYGDEFDAVYPALAEDHGVVLYPFFLDGVAAVPALNQADGIHPTAEGVGVIVSRILPYVRELLDGL